MAKKTGVKSTTRKKTAKIEPANFVHLHNHSHYSLLDGLTKVPELIEHVKNLGMQAVALTDHGTLSGLIEFYETANKAGIKPILGIEAYVAPRKHTDKDPQKDKSYYHLVILAMNNQGYRNLMRLSTIANLDGFYYKPRIDHELLEKYNEGLIVLSGCIGGEIGDAMRRNQYEQAKKTAMWYRSVFGDRYYLEVQDHGHQWKEQAAVNRRILRLGEELGIDVVVTEDAHYLEHEDQEAHEILLCVQTGSYYNDPNRMSLKDMDLFVDDARSIAKRWERNPEVITNTKKVADRCNVEIDLGKIFIPKFPVPKGETEHSFLHKQTWRGLAWRYGGVSEKAKEKLSVAQARAKLSKDIIARAEYELGTIKNMGFEGYFLIVSDFVNWGKQQGIVFGPGRGSAAGSVVSYALRITELDPLKYDLLFERFLNPERISMPDIDIDIQDTRRDEVIQYVVEKYGQDRVAHIATFGTMAARNAIRDVSRVLEVPYADADRLAKMVPPPIQGRHIPLKKSIQDIPDLNNEYKSSKITKRVLDLAVRLEGTIRSHGVHAAGVVIAPEDIVKFTPLEMAQKGVVATQYSMGPIERLGLLKMDFLGLSNLTTIKNALRIIRKVWNEEIDIGNLALDDKETYALLGRGDTTGIFQFESSGMKRYLKDLKPQVFDDIIAMGALYRPGPLSAGLTDKFIARKNGKEKVTYEHKSMKGALKSTYGVLVYQEQVMRIAQDMCGFSGAQADTLRKAMGKKNHEMLNRLKTEFVDGALKTSGVTKEFATRFWKDLEGFADYAFNKSHSACYGMISYQTAYLKAHYPQAFMAALMTSDYNDTDRLAIEISECRAMGIEVLPPDVNESFLEFAVVPESMSIRFGMAAIKNVGIGAVEEILRARDSGGKFQSIKDFAMRVDSRIVNRKAMESLVKAGAFDRFATRSALLKNLDMIIGFSAKLHKEVENGQSDLFSGSLMSDDVVALDFDNSETEVPEREKLQWERELLGIYLSSHPLDPFAAYLRDQTMQIASLKPNMNGSAVEIGGIVTKTNEIITKNGQRMAFVSVEDLTGEVELIVFPSTYEELKNTLEADSIIRAKGKISTKDRSGHATEEVKVLVEEIVVLSQDDIRNYRPKAKSPEPTHSTPSSKSSSKKVSAQAKKTNSPDAKRLFIHVLDPDNHQELLRIKQTLNRHPGSTEAILVLGENNKSAVRLPFRVEVGKGVETELAEFLSEKCIALR